MKNINKLLFTSVLSLSFILVSLESRASENLEVTIIENSRMLRMEVNNPSIEVINVFLYNEKNNSIFSKRVELGETFENQFDFTGLKNGTYKLVSEVAHMKVNRVLEVRDSQVYLMDSYYSFLPVFSQTDNMLSVQYINNGRKDIGLSIEGPKGVLYDTFNDDGDLVFSKGYSLENLEYGKYTFQISSQGEFYTHEFELD